MDNKNKREINQRGKEKNKERADWPPIVTIWRVSFYILTYLKILGIPQWNPSAFFYCFCWGAQYVLEVINRIIPNIIFQVC